MSEAWAYLCPLCHKTGPGGTGYGAWHSVDCPNHSEFRVRQLEKRVEVIERRLAEAESDA